MRRTYTPLEDIPEIPLDEVALVHGSAEETAAARARAHRGVRGFFRRLFGLEH